MKDLTEEERLAEIMNEINMNTEYVDYRKNQINLVDQYLCFPEKS